MFQSSFITDLLADYTDKPEEQVTGFMSLCISFALQV
jgi:hypothetical protein